MLACTHIARGWAVEFHNSPASSIDQSSQSFKEMAVVLRLVLLDLWQSCITCGWGAEHKHPVAGRASLAAQWFHTLGFTCPYGVNVADYILDVASGTVTSSKLDPDAAAEHLIACSER